MNRKLGTEISTMIFVLAVTFISIALSTIAYAIPGDSICDKDIVRLCPGVQPGDGRIGKCLAKDNLTVDLKCRALYEAFRATRIRMKNSCYKDVTKFCKEVRPGSGRVVHCLNVHLEKLSDDCRAQLKEMTPLNR